MRKRPWNWVALLVALLAFTSVCGALAHAGAASVRGDDNDERSSVRNAALVAPDLVRVEATNDVSISIKWSKRGRGDNTRYRVFRDGVLQLTTSDTDVKLKSLACGQTYRLGVAASDGAGNTSATMTIVAMTMPCGGGLAVALSAPSPAGAGALLHAEVGGPVKNVSFGFCPSSVCKWSSATSIGSTKDDDSSIRWRSPPGNGTYTLLAHVVGHNGRSADSQIGRAHV